MIDLIARINFAIAIVGLSFAIMGLMLIRSVKFLDRQTRNFFTVFFIIIFSYVMFDFLGQLTHNYHTREAAVIAQFLLFMESLVSSLLTVMTTGFLLQQSGDEHWMKNRIMHITVGLWVIYALFLIYTQFTGVFYSFDDENNYSRGPYYPMLLVPLVLIMLINIIVLFLKKDRLSDRQRHAFRAYAVVPLLSMVIQMFSYGIYSIVLGTTIAAMYIVLYIINDQVEKHFLKEEENAKLKIDILLAQIQPHFLYNSLSTVKYLCRKDPEKAEEAITRFSEYLRHNMDSLTMDMPIPFTKALDHTKAYLELQRLRFGDDLKVEFDLECEDFNIPSLTLQPIVENAVTYGVRKKESGEGTIVVRTRRFDDHVEVSVTDDGPGFDYDEATSNSERSHLGIKNVKERLSRIAGGELKIDSEKGKGTVVTILLPV